MSTSTSLPASSHVLAPWCFDEHFQQLFSKWRTEHPGERVVIGRVATCEHGVAEVIAERVAVATSDTSDEPRAVDFSDSPTVRILCEPTGTARREFRQSQGGEPVSGDWVVLDAAAVSETTTTGAASAGRIVGMLPRRSQLRRRMAGSHSKTQIVAVNVDKVFVVTSANNDFNARRLERYLVAVWDSGATPVVVLNKIDLTNDADAFLREIEAVAVGVDVIAVSARLDQGMTRLGAKVGVGETVALVGSSGVGKSSLLNRLVGREIAETSDVDADDKGRHTTTRRSLVALPNGGVLCDNPGMREFGLVDSEDGLDSTFSDIAGLASACRFHDCAHHAEPGCAVVDAVSMGVLSQQRLDSFHKLSREMESLRARVDKRLQSELKQRYKTRTKALRALTKPQKRR